MKKALLALFGGFFGILIVKGFFLNFFEELAWKVFWEQIFGNPLPLSFEDIVTSNTFKKCFFGFIVGTISTYIVAMFMADSQKSSDNNEIEEQKEISNKNSN